MIARITKPKEIKKERSKNPAISIPAIMEMKKFLKHQDTDVKINIKTLERVGHHNSFVMLQCAYDKGKSSVRVIITKPILKKLLNKEKIE